MMGGKETFAASAKFSDKISKVDLGDSGLYLRFL